MGTRPRSTALSEDEYSLRTLTGFDDFDACVELQKVTWGNDFNELVPPAIMKITQHVGGILVGAFDEDERLVGFVYGITGRRDGRPVHWSHMLAVLPELRDRGIGRRLKLHQRDRLIATGIDRMMWTFDPLVARNAHLNLNRIGARVISYEVDMYGSSLGEATGAVSTDRFVVEWDVARDDSGPGEPVRPVAAVEISADFDDEQDLPAGPIVSIEIPRDVEQMRIDDPYGEVAWRSVTRRAFIHYLSSGYLVRGLRSAAGRRHYVLEAPS